MYTIENTDDFRIFMASKRIVPECNAMIARTKNENCNFLAAHPQPTPAMPLTGSFVYAHAPNYRGLPMVHADKAEWLRELTRLKSYGVDLLVFQAALWSELAECYYPSKAFGQMKQFNVIDPLLDAAEELDLQVFLGGYGSVTGWRDDLSREDITLEGSNQAICFHELLTRYRGRFSGFYFTPETAFHGERDRNKELLLNQLYRSFCSMIKSEAPDLRILMSPGTKYYANQTPEMIACWRTILDGVPLDVMAPQDSVGCCGNALAHQRETFEAWRAICDPLGIEFWSNVEVFERKDDVLQLDHSICAPLERIKAQMNHAAPFAKKLISWELLYYPTPAAGGDCQKLADYLLSGK